MQYYERLGLSREPFSNSPDPEFLYYSGQHIACLQELEIAVRLRRGLNVVIGKVGTGKTTLIRRFIKNMSSDDSMRLHLVLDPYFKSAHAFLRMLCAQVLGEMPDRRLNEYALKEILKKELYHRGVDQDIASVLIVDEGQKMTPECLEVLRELLNYETNNKKLLQILLFGQTELGPILKSMDNLLDRINSYLVLHPLTFKETRAMINYRLALCTPIGKPTPRLLTGPAYYAIHRATKGYPRKTVRLCHKIILNLLIRKKKCAGMGMVRSVVKEELNVGYRSRPVALATTGFALLLVVGLGAVRYVPQVRSMAQGIQSAVASSFASDAHESSPFAPVQTGPKADETSAAASIGTTGLDSSLLGQEANSVIELDASNNGSMTLDEYFSEDVEPNASPNKDDLSTNADMKSEATKPAVEQSEMVVDEVAMPHVMEEVRVTRYEPLSVNADKAAHALGVVKTEPDAPKKQTTGMVAVKSNPAPVSAPALQSVSVGDIDKPAEIGEYYELPTQMGRLPVMPQESLSVIIRKVYGVYDQANLRQVIAANPGLRNVNDIVVGQPLIFPVINPGNRQLDQSLSWLCFSVERRLDKAYGRLRAATLFGFDSRLLPYVAADGALAFAVVMERPFQTAEEAEIERGCLPLALQKEASVMRTPNSDVSLAQMNDLATNVLQAKLTQ